MFLNRYSGTAPFNFHPTRLGISMTWKIFAAIVLVAFMSIVGCCVLHKPAASSVNSTTMTIVEPEDGQTPATVYAVALCGQSSKGMDIEVTVPATGFKATIFNLCNEGEQAAVYYRCTVPVRKQVGTEVFTYAWVHGGEFNPYQSARWFGHFKDPMAVEYLIARDSIPMPRCCSWNEQWNWDMRPDKLPWPGTTEFTGPPASDGSWSDNPACVP